MKPETRTVQVYLHARVLCDVDVEQPMEDGVAEIRAIRIADQGNVQSLSDLEPASLSAEEYDAIDDAAGKAWESGSE